MGAAAVLWEVLVLALAAAPAAWGGFFRIDLGGAAGLGRGAAGLSTGRGDGGVGVTRCVGGAPSSSLLIMISLPEESMLRSESLSKGCRSILKRGGLPCALSPCCLSRRSRKR